MLILHILSLVDSSEGMLLPYTDDNAGRKSARPSLSEDHMIHGLRDGGHMGTIQDQGAVEHNLPSC